MGATLQHVFFINALITELLPTFGYPIRPTEIFFLSLWRISNCFRSWMSDPLPNGFETLAWKASVGYDFERYLIHLFVMDVGIRSHLFRMKTKCLFGHFYFR